MKIQSKFFGTTEIQPETIISMIQPIYGFESAKQFTIITDAEIGTEMMWFQSIDDANLCFVLANPSAFNLEVPTQLPEEVMSVFEVQDASELDVAYILNIADSFEEATVNLKSPIFFNPVTNQAAQVILPYDLPLKQRLFASC